MMAISFGYKDQSYVMFSLVHDISRALDLNATVFVLFVYGEKLLLNHILVNKPLPCYLVLSLYSPSASKLSSKSLTLFILLSLFIFRTISQPWACITRYNIPRKWCIHKVPANSRGTNEYEQRPVSYLLGRSIQSFFDELPRLYLI